jgi:tetratricopeptide (TPR) repeat protein
MTLYSDEEQFEQAELYLEEGAELARQVRSARLGWHLIWLGVAKSLQGKAEHALALYQEAVACARQVGDREAMANALQSLGIAYCQLGDAAHARPPLEEALRAYQEQGYLMGIGWTLMGLGGVCALEGQGDRLARLVGAQEALVASIGGRQVTALVRIADQFMSPVRAALGEERWVAAFTAGRALSLEQAIAEALGETTE